MARRLSLILALVLVSFFCFSLESSQTALGQSADSTVSDSPESAEGNSDSDKDKADEEPELFGDRYRAIVDDPDLRTTQKGQAIINLVFGAVAGALGTVLMYGVPTGIGAREGVTGTEIPLILLILITGGVFFTFRFRFVNLRLFGHCLQVIRGKFDKPDDVGEVSHFQALTSALSATVGLGNIASVAVAISLGGPGAVFWMWCVAFFGMSSKFSSCSLAQLYRRVKPDGTILGGPMIYLEEGIKDRFPRLAPLGKIFGVMFAVFTVCAAFGGGNMFQGNQTFSMFKTMFGEKTEGLDDYAWVMGAIMAVLVGLVIVGGIRRIGEVTSKLIPAMCGLYCAVCLVILGTNAGRIPSMLGEIVTSAFEWESFYGGMIGVLIIGASRAAFSNEAGLGSAAIAHAAARTEEPIREGIVAMIGPFIDTIVVCTMTALAILVTGAHLDPATGAQFAPDVAKTQGVQVTARAFASLGPILPYFLCVAVFVFAYSTMISWSYYGEKAIEYLFGERAIKPYRFVYLFFVILGPILTLEKVIDFSDMMLFSMAFPNILGMVLLSGMLKSRADDYIRRLKSGEMSPEK